MLPSTVLYDFAVAWRHVRRVARWIRRHKARTFAIIVGTWLLVSLLGGHAVSALAADGEGVKALPFLSALNPKDSGGVDLLHYVFLPVDRGNPLTNAGNFFVTNIADPIWLWNIFMLSWSLWFLEFLITMQWVSWLVAPLQVIFSAIADIIARVGWVTTATIIAGLIVTIAFFRGQMASGIVKMIISCSAFALAGTLLVNPLGIVTGPEGLIQKAKDAGGAIGAAFATGNADLLNQPPSSDVSQDIVTTTLIGQVMDSWVRLPAQEIAFGHVLSGKCAEVFNKVMMEVSPLDTGSSKVRDAISACDPAAGDYANHPTIANALSAGFAGAGAQILSFLTTALGVILLISIGYSLYKLIQWMIANIGAIAGFAYTAWWSGLIGTFVGILSVALCLILVSAFLTVTTSLMKTLSGIPGLSTIAQLAILTLFVLTLSIALIWQWVKAKKAGERLAERLARLTAGRAAERRPQPIRSTVKRVAERYIGNKLASWNRTAPPAPDDPGPRPPQVSPFPAAAGAGTGAVQALGAGTSAKAVPALAGPVMQLTALPAGKGGAKEKAAALLSTGVTVGLAAASGGASAAVLALTKQGGKYVLQRGVQSVAEQIRKDKSDEVANSPRDREESVHRPTFTGFGRRIEVDQNGVSRIAPREAPERGGVYRIAPASTPSASTAHLRERLQRAAAGTAGPVR